MWITIRTKTTIKIRTTRIKITKTRITTRIRITRIKTTRTETTTNKKCPEISGHFLNSIIPLIKIL